MAAAGSEAHSVGLREEHTWVLRQAEHRGVRKSPIAEPGNCQICYIPLESPLLMWGQVTELLPHQ